MARIFFTTLSLCLLSACAETQSVNLDQRPAFLVMGGEPRIAQIAIDPAPVFPTAPADFFLGDSIIHRLDVADVRLGSVDLGIEGATTSQIIGEARSVPKNASVVFLEGGINDLHNTTLTPQQIAANYTAILAALPPGIPVKVIGILPIDPTLEVVTVGAAKATTNQIISQTNMLIAGACHASAGCSFIGNPFGAALPASATIDGVHLSPSGSATLITALDHSAIHAHAWHMAGMHAHAMMHHAMPHCAAMHMHGKH